MSEQEPEWLRVQGLLRYYNAITTAAVLHDLLDTRWLQYTMYETKGLLILVVLI